MIEVAAAEAGGAEQAAAGAQGPTAGAMLRAARESAGLHVAALAVAMKVPVAKLDALENDRYDLLPDAVFARALAASICRTLKVDAVPVLARLPQTAKPRLVQDTDGINAPFRSPRDAVASHWKDLLTRPVALTVGALLVGAVVVVLLPRQPDDGLPAAATSSSPPAAEPPQPVATGAAEAPAAPAAATPPAEVMTASAAMPSPPTAATAADPAATGDSAAAAATAAPAATASAPAAAAASGVIVFRASAESWIEVRDAAGAVPVRKLLAAGETVGASGAMPLQVTVGNAGATAVQVRGKPFDLGAITRDNVARFEVK